MKKILAVLTLTLAAIASHAQTPTNSPAPGGVTVTAPTPLPAPPSSNTTFFQTVQAYFTTLNPAYDSTFGTNKGSAWVGVISAQGQSLPLQNEIGVSYNVAKMLQIEAVTRDGGVTGGIISLQAGLGLTAVVHDVKMTAYADGGANIAKQSTGQKAYCELGFRADKALTEHTFAGVQLSVRPIDGERFFGAHTGFTF